jgi:hypothetical protein
MARNKRDVWEAKPHKPIPYGPLARFVDWRIGRKDGRAGAPTVAEVPPGELVPPLITEYLDQLGWGCRGAAEEDNRQALRDVQHLLKRRDELMAEAAQALERSSEIQKELDAMPETPPESVLQRRNAVEQHADELLIRARRAREYAAVREKAKAAKQRVDEARSACLVELAHVNGAISVRRLALHVRVRRQWAYTMMRRAAYLRHLRHHHPDGAALRPYFELSAPELPGWLESWPDGQDSAVVLPAPSRMPEGNLTALNEEEHAMRLLADLSWRHRLRRRRRAAAGDSDFAWEDALGDYRGVSASRYTRLMEIDRWRPVPFDMPPPPERDSVHRRVRDLIEGLEGAIDEGSGGALDRHIESWVAAWVAGVETEYADHCGLIQMFRGQAEQWVRETTVELEHARAKLGRLMSDYEALGRKLRDSGIAAPEALPEDEDGGDGDSGPAAEDRPEPGPANPPESSDESKDGLEIEFNFGTGGGS